MTHVQVQRKLPGAQPQQGQAEDPIQEAHERLDRAKWHSPVVGLLILIWPCSIAPGRPWLLAPVLPCA